MGSFIKRTVTSFENDPSLDPWKAKPLLQKGAAGGDAVKPYLWGIR